MEKSLAAIILAAGRGKRMQAQTLNKVVLPIAKKPMILHCVELLEYISVSAIIVVVGFAKESVKKALEDKNVIFADQKDQLGTAHAVMAGLEKIPSRISDVLVLQGDDSLFYSSSLIKKLLDSHLSTKSAMTLLTIEVENPAGLGRILRAKKGEIVGIVEEKDATEEQRKIREINPACYVFNVAFLKKNLKKIKKSKVTGEYYLTDLVGMAVSSQDHVETVSVGKIPWRGINTKEELKEAEKLFSFINTYGAR